MYIYLYVDVLYIYIYIYMPHFHAYCSELRFTNTQTHSHTNTHTHTHTHTHTLRGRNSLLARSLLSVDEICSWEIQARRHKYYIYIYICIILKWISQRNLKLKGTSSTTKSVNTSSGYPAEAPKKAKTKDKKNKKRYCEPLLQCCFS